mmetsp:Transcript_12232/g.23752  ORF Transcript_12232/g.23752 Transcript_12232/m.23752 type:complete len:268 (-) Transcript_12232:12-815(-)
MGWGVVGDFGDACGVGTDVDAGGFAGVGGSGGAGRVEGAGDSGAAGSGDNVGAGGTVGCHQGVSAAGGAVGTAGTVGGIHTGGAGTGAGTGTGTGHGTSMGASCVSEIGQDSGATFAAGPAFAPTPPVTASSPAMGLGFDAKASTPEPGSATLDANCSVETSPTRLGAARLGSAKWRATANVTSTTKASVAAATQCTRLFKHFGDNKLLAVLSAHKLRLHPCSPPSRRSDACSGDSDLQGSWLDASSPLDSYIIAATLLRSGPKPSS